MGVVPVEKGNDFNRAGREWLQKYTHPETGETIESYPINRAAKLACTADKMKPYCSYLNRDEIWAVLERLAPDDEWDAAWMAFFKKPLRM